MGEFHYPTEGWGITNDGEHLIMSDGTSTLQVLDPESLNITRQIEVYDRQGPVTGLNKLQYIQNEIFANVLQTDYIVRIDPETGQVVGWIHLKGLLSPNHSSESVGIINGLQIGLRTLWKHSRGLSDYIKGIRLGIQALLGAEHKINPVDVLNGIVYDKKMTGYL